MKTFAPVGNGRVLAYFFARENETLSYLRGTSVLRITSAGGETRYAAVGDEIARGDFDLPPLGGATRAAKRAGDRAASAADRRVHRPARR